MTAAEWYQLLRQYEAAGATMAAEGHPIILAKGKGSEVWDADGQRYIDACSGFGSLPLGHGHASFHKALAIEDHGLVQGLGDVYSSLDKIELLRALCDLTPFDTPKAMLALSGGQAVEIALKTALLATRKTKVLAFEGGYHGLDFGSLAVTSREDFRLPFRCWLPQDRIKFAEFGAPIEHLQELIATLEDDLAAIIVEPIQGRAGVRVPTPEWLRTLRDLANANDALLIFDEVFTGCGRTGSWFQADHYKPDLICVGKALGGGMPLSACVGDAEIIDSAWPETAGEALHTGTFFGHPLSCRVGLATLREIESHGLVDRARGLGDQWKADFIGEIARLGVHCELRGVGLMLGLDFHRPLAGVAMMRELTSRHVIAIPSGADGSVLSLSPALNFPDALASELLEKIVASVESLKLNGAVDY